MGRVHPDTVTPGCKSCGANSRAVLWEPGDVTFTEPAPARSTVKPDLGVPQNHQQRLAPSELEMS